MSKFKKTLDESLKVRVYLGDRNLFAPNSILFVFKESFRSQRAPEKVGFLQVELCHNEFRAESAAAILFFNGDTRATKCNHTI